VEAANSVGKAGNAPVFTEQLNGTLAVNLLKWSIEAA
jgi:hypothetical protein